MNIENWVKKIARQLDTKEDSQAIMNLFIEYQAIALSGKHYKNNNNYPIANAMYCITAYFGVGIVETIISTQYLDNAHQ